MAVTTRCGEDGEDLIEVESELSAEIVVAPPRIPIIARVDPLALPPKLVAAERARLAGERAARRERARPNNTTRAYEGDWRRFEAWCRKLGHRSLPTTSEILVEYVSHLVSDQRPPERPGGDGGPCKPSTVTRAIASIREQHERQGLRPPDATPARRELREARRDLKPEIRQAAPLLVSHLRKIMAIMPEGDPVALRDRAVILAGWGWALRREEIERAERAHVSFVDDYAYLSLPYSKANQEGAPESARARAASDPMLCPLRALRTWLKYSEGTIDRIFCRTRGAVDRRLDTRSPMPAREVDDVVKRWTAAAGLSPHRRGLSWSAHSLRAGFATQARMMGWSDEAIMKRTRHRSRAMIGVYVRLADEFLNQEEREKPLW